MYNLKDLQFEGNHDFIPLIGGAYWCNTVSVGIYQLIKTANGKSLKPTKAIVRVSGTSNDLDSINKKAEEVVKLLDAGEWNGAKTVKIK